MLSITCRLLGEERSIVSDVAGTTRDTVDAMLTRGNSTYRFVDTAGIRKRGKVEYGPEFFMVNRCVNTLLCVDISRRFFCFKVSHQILFFVLALIFVK